ncbi:hypothetical protein [Ensifer sp. 4252]|uniref:hypothetical protein n=1 Tax=Ensifer sp. 4252 TaxID=3373915 RepID=UPI003D2353E8
MVFYSRRSCIDEFEAQEIGQISDGAKKIEATKELTMPKEAMAANDLEKCKSHLGNAVKGKDAMSLVSRGGLDPSPLDVPHLTNALIQLWRFSHACRTAIALWRAIYSHGQSSLTRSGRRSANVDRRGA